MKMMQHPTAHMACEHNDGEQQAVDQVEPHCDGWKLASRLFVDNYQRLVRAARRHVWNEGLAEEAVQDAFVRFGDVHERCAPGSEVAYLRSMAVNNARTMARRRALHDALPIAGPDHQMSVEETCLQAEKSKELHSAIRTLPARQQEVLTMRYLQGRSERETAEALNIAPGSVKVHASRGRAQMRRTLADTASS